MKFIVTVDKNKLDPDISKMLVADYIRTALGCWGHGSDPHGESWQIADSCPTVTHIPDRSIITITPI